LHRRRGMAMAARASHAPMFKNGTRYDDLAADRLPMA
jgi:hypothetical protein